MHKMVTNNVKQRDKADFKIVTNSDEQRQIV